MTSQLIIEQDRIYRRGQHGHHNYIYGIEKQGNSFVKFNDIDGFDKTSPDYMDRCQYMYPVDYNLYDYISLYDEIRKILTINRYENSWLISVLPEYTVVGTDPFFEGKMLIVTGCRHGCITIKFGNEISYIKYIKSRYWCSEETFALFKQLKNVYNHYVIDEIIDIKINNKMFIFSFQDSSPSYQKNNEFIDIYNDLILQQQTIGLMEYTPK